MLHLLAMAGPGRAAPPGRSWRRSRWSAAGHGEGPARRDRLLRHALRHQADRAGEARPRRVPPYALTAQELQDAKDYLTGSFVFAFESSPQIARFLVHAEIYKLGFDYVEKYPEYIRAITIEDVARAAKMYLDSENYTLVVVGPVGEDGNPLDGSK